ncbi:MAG: PspC domain-containing protein [Saprospiraceae bacterium]|nr:PspC domain-containing protein [Saprospiraceae bacterium]
MNKTLNINLGGLPLTIDEDAFQKLDNYLHQLSVHFSKSESSKEILQDIEFRMAEIFKERMKTSSIVSYIMVEDAIKLMGMPSDIDYNSQIKEDTDNTYTVRKKKLFRDLQDKKIAGVCSGLAHYFGVDDPIWIRAIFLFGLLAGGSTILVYIVLWILVDPAVTSSDKLRMKGEPVNINNIASKVEEKFQQLTDRFEELIQKSFNK